MKNAAALLFSLLNAPSQVEALHGFAPAQAVVDVKGGDAADENAVEEGDAEEDTRPSIVEIKQEKAKVYPFTKKWDFFPHQARVGIVSGAPYEFYYGQGAWGNQSEELMLAYAQRHNYAVSINKDMGAMSDRDWNWNKVILAHKYLEDVPLLVWIDPSIFMTHPEASVEYLLKKAECTGAHQSRWEKSFPKTADANTWLWLCGDMHAGGHEQYLMNTNDGMMMLRRSKQASEFLEKVWKQGADLKLPERHAYANLEKIPGWPFENGGMWEVLAQNPDYMKETCVVPPGYAHTSWASLYAELGRRIEFSTPSSIRNSMHASALEKMRTQPF